MNRKAIQRNCGMALLTGGIALASGAAVAADVFEGRKVYELNCAVCHGPEGRGEIPGMPDFTRNNRALMQPDAVVFDTISNGKGGMPAFRGLLEEREILDAVAFMRTLIGRR